MGAGLVDVQRANQLVGPTGLFLMAIADSGERKSTVDGYFTKAIREYEAVQEELAQQALQDYRSALNAWEAKKAGTVNAIRDASKKGKETTQLERQLAVIEANRPEKPKIPKLLIGDAILKPNRDTPRGGQCHVAGELAYRAMPTNGNFRGASEPHPKIWAESHQAEGMSGCCFGCSGGCWPDTPCRRRT